MQIAKCRGRRTLPMVFLVVFGCGGGAEGVSRIETAVKNNDAKYVRAWLKNGGDPNSKDRFGRPLLHVATGPKGGDAVVSALLSHGVDPNSRCGGYTPLMNAASWSRLEACASLVRHGADVDALDTDGVSAMEHVAQAIMEAFPEILRASQFSGRE